MAAPFHLPGSYPGSAPQTPDETIQQQQHHQQIREPPHQHNHHQRNELYKPQDPRGHVATDSGVGLTDSEPISYTTQNEYRWSGPSEAVGGGTYVREHDNFPRNPDLPSQGAAEDVHTRKTDNDIPPRPTEVPYRESEEEFPQRNSDGGSRLSGFDYTGSSQSTTTENASRHDHGRLDTSEPPYWGNLPKAAGGGIYNTVTGHGSANDDHEQHHGLSQRSERSERSRITGIQPDVPGGGVYNTVAGHGSNDVENQRHSLSQSGGQPVPIKADIGAASNANPPPGPATSRSIQDTTGKSSVTRDGLLAAPLTAVPENQQIKSVGPSPSETINPAVTSTAIDSTPSQTNSLLAAPAPRGLNQEAPLRTSLSKPKPEPTSQRAFPLVPSHAGREDEPKLSGSRTRDNTLAVASGLGAGAAAYGIADKHKKGDQQVQHPEETRHSRSTSEDHGRLTTGGLFARKSRDEKRSASADKHKKNLHSEEKRHSKVFGLFHRHKDDEPKEDTSTFEPPARPVDRFERKEEVVAGTTSSPKTRNRLRKGSKNEGTRRSPESSTDSDNSSHGKEKLAAGTALGAGALGLHHHKKEENLKDAARKPHEQGMHTAPISQSTERNDMSAPASNKHSQLAAGAGAGMLAGVGGYGMAKRNHESTAQHALPVTEEVSTPFEHPREPPMPPQADTGVANAQRQSGQYNVLASGTSSGVGHSTKPTSTAGPNDGALLSGAPAGPQHTHKSEPHSSRGAIVTQEPGEYNHLPSGTASGVKQGSTGPSESKLSKSAMAMGAAGLGAAVKRESTHSSEPSAAKGSESSNYNHLHSGTASGIQRDVPSAGNTATTRPPNDRADSGPYNKLPSGTPSGVKIKPKEHRSRQTSEPAVHSQMAATMIPPRHSVDVPRKDLPLPPFSSSPTESNTPIHHTILHAPETGRATNPEPPAQAAPQFTSFPNPGMVQNMSPEVMPETYRQSVFPHQQAGQFTSFPNPGMVQNMSPEVMPETYRQSVSPPHTRQADGAERDLSPRGTTTNDAAWQQQQQQSKQSAPASSVSVPPHSSTFSSAPSSTQNNMYNQSKDRSTVDPALAAATASWGVTGGLPPNLSSLAPKNKVMHTCEHCGRENDVTALVRKAQERLG